MTTFIRLSQPAVYDRGVAGDVMSEHLALYSELLLQAIWASNATLIFTPDSKRRVLGICGGQRWTRNFPESGAKAVGCPSGASTISCSIRGSLSANGSLTRASLMRVDYSRAPEPRERKICGIATDCGFSDLSHFNRMFKARVGCTPREARLVCRPQKDPLLEFSRASCG